MSARTCVDVGVRADRHGHDLVELLGVVLLVGLEADQVGAGDLVLGVGSAERRAPVARSCRTRSGHRVTDLPPGPWPRSSSTRIVRRSASAATLTRRRCPAAGCGRPCRRSRPAAPPRCHATFDLPGPERGDGVDALHRRGPRRRRCPGSAGSCFVVTMKSAPTLLVDDRVGALVDRRGEHAAGRDERQPDHQGRGGGGGTPRVPPGVLAGQPPGRSPRTAGARCRRRRPPGGSGTG